MRQDLPRGTVDVNAAVAERTKNRYTPAIVRAKIKKILGKPVWGGRKTGGKAEAMAEENSRLKAEVKEWRAETARLKAALRVCWRASRDGENGDEVTRVVIAALGGKGGRAQKHQGKR